MNIFKRIYRHIILKWDPDFTRLTPWERERVEEAERELERGEVFSEDEINWD